MSSNICLLHLKGMVTYGDKLNHYFFFPTGKEKITSSYSSVIQENERKCLEMKNN